MNSNSICFKVKYARVCVICLVFEEVVYFSPAGGWHSGLGKNQNVIC